MKLSSPGVTIWKDKEAMSIAAAYFFTAAAQHYILKNGRFTVALSGGNTPKRFYELLATNEFSRNIDWKNIFICWSDERFVSHESNESNYRMAKESLLDHIPVPLSNIYAVEIKETARSSALNYEKLLIEKMGIDSNPIDWVMLGMGNDGHTASLFPGNEVLNEKEKLVSEVWLEEKKTWRISFTLPLINAAEQVVFLIAGKEKAPVINSINNNTNEPVLPVQMVCPGTGQIGWMVTEDVVS